MHYDVFKFLSPKHQELVPHIGSVLTADNNEMTGIIGKAKVNISLELHGKRKEFCTEAIVSRTIPYPLILGIRFMQEADLVIHPKERSVYYAEHDGRKSKENKVHFVDEVLVLSNEELKLAPRTRTILHVIAPKAKKGECVQFEPAAALFDSRKVTTPRGLVDGKTITPVEVVNLSEAVCTIKKGEVIGRGDVIESDSVQPADDLFGCENERRAPDLLMHLQDDSRPHRKKTKSALADLHLGKGKVRVGADLSKGQAVTLKQMLEANSDIMAFDEKTLGRCTLFKHRIELEESKPISCPPARKSGRHREMESKMVDSYLDEGIIRPSISPWASRTVIVPKKGGELRFCVDYRRLNQVTKRDVYPLMNIEDALSSLAGAQLFTSMDLNKGYWQIEVEDEDKEKTAFVTQDGLFEFNRMPFGLSNAPATFQRTMDVLLSGLKWNQCLVYLDDVLIFASSFVQMMDRMERVFKRIRQANMTINP